MAGRTPHEAVQNFLGPLQRTLSRFTPNVLFVGGGYFLGAEHVATVNGGLPFPLAGDQLLSLVLNMRYRIIEAPEPAAGPWRVETTGYLYSILREQKELITYHWHPASAVTWPHLHLGPESGDVLSELTRVHVPTGRRVAVEQVLRLAFELGAQPLANDWEDMLNSSLSLFERWRRW